MPFIHRGCGGTVGLISGKCSKCHKQFKPNSSNQHGMPDGVIYENSERVERLKAKATAKGKTDYAKWADKAPVPGVSTLASRLPNWPRWARILTTAGIATGLILIIRGCV